MKTINLGTILKGWQHKKYKHSKRQTEANKNTHHKVFTSEKKKNQRRNSQIVKSWL